ncbi:MAG: ABC transporter substrate-binding protein [Thiothrix sp.]|nr:MAG: ABC transporter substrate-binding protein [Thiothrix sp.]
MNSFKQWLVVGLTLFSFQSAVQAAQVVGKHSGLSYDDSQVTKIRYLKGQGQVSSHELADALGWFKDEGIEFEPVGYSSGGPESLMALSAGSVDIAGAATSAIINAIIGGADIKAVSTGTGVNTTVVSHFYVLDNSPIHSAADLAGKVIAVNTLGAHLDYVVKEYLRKNNVDPNSVKLVVVPGPQLDQVLRSGQVDVAAVGTWQATFAGEIEKGGGVRTLFTDYDVLGDIALGYTVFSNQFIKEHPDAVARFATLSAKAADWSQAHLEEAKQTIGKTLEARKENGALAQYWKGYGTRPHALIEDRDSQFWLDILARDGNTKAKELKPSQIHTNEFNKLIQ